MGRVKEWLMDLEEHALERHIAKLLKISYEDLTKLEWEIETDKNEEGLEYSHRIEFKENSSVEILAKIERLKDNCRVYLEPWELNANYDYINDQFDAITESRINQIAFNKELDNLKELSNLQSDGDRLKKILNRQIFISIIGCMETFLSETFLRLTIENKIFYQAFVQTHPEFKTRKFELREIFMQQKQLDLTIKKTILDTIFHNLPTIKNMYEDTFSIHFPPIKEMYSYVLLRHDLVHRNGKTKDGKDVEIADDYIDKVILDTKDFIEKICIELKIK
jgi:hypothetical protein